MRARKEGGRGPKKSGLRPKMEGASKKGGGRELEWRGEGVSLNGAGRVQAEKEGGVGQKRGECGPKKSGPQAIREEGCRPNMGGVGKIYPEINYLCSSTLRLFELMSMMQFLQGAHYNMIEDRGPAGMDR